MSNDEINKIFDTFKYGSDLVPFAEEWRYVDSFTVDQAAYLWCGVEPSGKYEPFAPKKPQQFAAIKQMLIGAIEAKVLGATKSLDLLRADGDALVSRHALKAFAEIKKAYPAFLFEPITLANPKENNPKSNDTIPEADEKNKGGKPPDYDWSKIWAGVIFLEGEDGLPDKLGDLADRMIDFVEFGYSFTESSREDVAPSKPHMEKRLRDIYNEYKRVKRRHNEEKLKKS